MDTEDAEGKDHRERSQGPQVLLAHCVRQHTETSQWWFTESSLENREDEVKERRPNAAQPAKVGVGIEPGQSGESLQTMDTNCLSDETVGTKRKVLPQGCGLGSLSSVLLSFIIFSNFNLTGPQGAGILVSPGKAAAGTAVGRD